MKLVKEKVLPLIMNALTEDVGGGDVTTTSLFEKDKVVMADIITREECVLAGIDIVRWIFNALDEKIVFRSLSKDGDRVKKGKRVISLKGSIRSILAGERTALNFLGRLSGVATLTRRFVEKVKSKKVRIFDTRKTTPGLRVLEKYAVRVGGGHNHRMGLWDGILIKDNHIEGLRPVTVKDAVKKTRAKGYKNIEIELDDLKGFSDIQEAGIDIIMLDNMKIEDIRKAVRSRTSGVELEVSGGVTLENVARIANTGVERISIGSLTHSAPSIDFSLGIC
ncbi:MAG: carboxylating nicotinate-nucleotide diphosphorylase [Candidatus Omnitrophota bacterium]